MNQSKTAISLAVLLGTLACSTQATTPTDSPVSNAVPAQAVMSSPGKPTAPATVQFLASPGATLLGAPLSVRVVVSPSADVDELEVRFGLTDGLTTANALPVLRLGAQKAGTKFTQDLVISPRTEGQHYLSAFVHTLQGRQRMTKVVSHSVAVGNALPKAGLPVLTDPNGERVISMPASEPTR